MLALSGQKFAFLVHQCTLMQQYMRLIHHVQDACTNVSEI